MGISNTWLGIGAAAVLWAPGVFADAASTYMACYRAVSNSDLAILRDCVSKTARVDGQPVTDEILRNLMPLMREWQPKKLQIVRQLPSNQGEGTILIVKGDAYAAQQGAFVPSNGQVLMAKEDGHWRIVSEAWGTGLDQ